MKIAIVANGQIQDDKKIFEKLKNYDFIIAADGGATHCLRLGLTPNLMIGDFDSISDEAFKAFSHIPKSQVLKDKDETDLELAIHQAFSLTSDKVTLFAATGNRVDHTLVNLQILRRFPSKLFIETETETIFALNSTLTEAYEISTSPGKTISFLPMTKDAKGVTTKGLKWELNDATLNEKFLSISNICLTSTTFISIESGDLLCFLL